MLRNALEPWHLLLVAIAFIVLFGSKRLPDAARSLGRSLRILKSETRALREDGAESAAAPTPPPGSGEDGRAASR
ncbi:Sec-independent protein translocase subunit TatA [Streptomyces sp. NPDC059247]|uniref:Sec-independent protein translocase subunit TatA n=1 Tax=Streptomyces sp. NPDC059247 TaxID=3346790 RepID=UPI0036C56F99